ncbi:MAG TPA: hypothetical protein VJ044_10500 [Candidatus Hodarchaeales archaeon]|nr:hypothetical protein [Candidatus Hodarchaeales archaeon]
MESVSTVDRDTSSRVIESFGNEQTSAVLSWLRMNEIQGFFRKFGGVNHAVEMNFFLAIASCVRSNSVPIYELPIGESETFDNLGGRVPFIDRLPSQIYYYDEEEKDINDFLEMNSFLLGLIREAVEHLDLAFGTSRFRLEHFVDFDEPHVRQLFVKVPCSCSVREARNKLKEFDESWWFRNLVRAQRKLEVNIEFIGDEQL